METDLNLTRRDEYLRNARDAEEYAKRTSNAAARDGWLRIAKSYHDLAVLIPSRRRA